MEGRLTAESFALVKNIHINWYIHAIKALMGQVGRQLYEKLTAEEQKILRRCLDKIEDERELVHGARCLIQARKLARLKNIGFDETDVAFLQEKTSDLTEIEKKFTIPESSEEEVTKSYEPATTTPLPEINLEHQPITHNSLSRIKSTLEKQLFREAIKEIQRESSTLSSNDYLFIEQEVSGVGRQIRKKKKDSLEKAKQKLALLSQSNWEAKLKDDSETTPPDSLASLSSAEPTPVSQLIKDLLPFKYRPKRYLDDTRNASKSRRIADLIWSFANGMNPEKGGLKSYKELLKLGQVMEDKKKLPGAKIYEFRLHDIVLNRKKPSRSKRSEKPFPDFLTMTSRLVDALNGHKNRPEDTSFKFLSPRFAPLMPEKVPAKSRLLSPSFLSFYSDDSSDNIASIPKILEKSGLKEQDRDTLMELIMSLSGAGKTVDMMLEVIKKINFFGMGGEIFETTRWLDSLFKKLSKSFNKEQKNDIDMKGFTFLEKQQIKDLLDGHKVKHPQQVGFDLEEYGNMTAQQKYDALWERIEAIAKNTTEVGQHRQKRQISVLNPIILAPYMFAPVTGHSVLGPVVLSPSIFSPLILNPALLGPFILSPGVGNPFILSPYLLTPYILSPLVMAPFILTPYVLSPNIINPYVLSPIILSPYVLSPDILSPATLGGPILSPSVLSPAVLTESVLMANILSPTFMS
ncbi:unnamed protein product [Enterobius vermicularis]|uniref:ULP_PROTEASE domain-containing protein n=1 Tax=Enterobius vermicularis TaxID=51028 RepID=A0A0N4UVW5_ENTVE|nr:unnamed protein product [Enterobius vermicularis]